MSDVELKLKSTCAYTCTCAHTQKGNTIYVDVLPHWSLECSFSSKLMFTGIKWSIRNHISLENTWKTQKQTKIQTASVNCGKEINSVTLPKPQTDMYY